MSNDHIVELPKAVWGIKIVQAIICVLILAFSAFEIAVFPNGYSGFCIFTVSLSKNLNVETKLISFYAGHLFWSCAHLLLRVNSCQQKDLQLDRTARS